MFDNFVNTKFKLIYSYTWNMFPYILVMLIIFGGEGSW